jgi:hypothetical protein
MESLAACGAARAELCQCGEIHVSIGPFTVRLPRDHFESLAVCFEQAMATLEARQTRPPLRLLRNEETNLAGHCP